jgi:FkbM family methyltransferase
MRNVLKKLSRPFIRRTLSMTEPLVGFWTDPTGFLPNRFDMLRGHYEKFLIQSISKALPEDGVFVDIGANVGFISRQIARRFPRVRIVAFEPNPRIYPLLQRNLKHYPNCKLLQVGLGATDGILDFFHGEDSCVGSFVPGYTSEHAGNYLGGAIKQSKIAITTGDVALSEIKAIAVMKMDVEGYEIEVLRGMSRLLAEHTIKTIFFEFHPFAQKCAHVKPEEIIYFLMGAGYAVCEVEGESRDTPVRAENIAALIARLGDRGYTTLRAEPRPTN